MRIGLRLVMVLACCLVGVACQCQYYVVLLGGSCRGNLDCQSKRCVRGRCVKAGQSQEFTSAEVPSLDTSVDGGASRDGAEREARVLDRAGREGGRSERPIDQEARCPTCPWFTAASTQSQVKALTTASDGSTVAVGEFRKAICFERSCVRATKDSNQGFVTRFAEDGKSIYHLGLLGDSDIYPEAVASAGQGQAVVVGYFSGTARFATTTLTAKGDWDLFVTLIDATGKILWAKSMGGQNSDYAYGVAVSAKGQILLTGAFAGKASFGGISLSSPSSSSSSCLLLRLSLADAKVAAAKAFVSQPKASSPTATCRGLALALTKDGKEGVLAGVFGGILFVDGASSLLSRDEPDQNRRGLFDAFVLRFSTADLSQRWSVRAGGSGTDWAETVSIDTQGQTVIAGQFSQKADFGTLSLTSAQEGRAQDLYLARLDAKGSFLWAQSIKGGGPVFRSSVATNVKGEILLGAAFQNKITVGNQTLASRGGQDMSAMLFNGKGRLLRSLRQGNTSDDVIQGVGFDTQGLIVLGGFFSREIRVLDRLRRGAVDLEKRPLPTAFVWRLKP